MHTFQILLVDDEKDFVDTLAERLRLRDQDVTVAYNGKQALTYIKDHQPDVVVLDLRMPGMDGIDVLKAIKEDYPDIEVVILSGKGTNTDKVETKILNAFEYIEKPADVDKILDVTKRAHLSRFEKIMAAATFAQADDEETARKILEDD